MEEKERKMVFDSCKTCKFNRQLGRSDIHGDTICVKYYTVKKVQPDLKCNYYESQEEVLDYTEEPLFDPLIDILIQHNPKMQCCANCKYGTYSISSHNNTYNCTNKKYTQIYYVADDTDKIVTPTDVCKEFEYKV